MRLRRLGWAGIELHADGTTLVIDHMLDAGILSAFFGDGREELLAPAEGTVEAALVTHLHRDHADVAAIERALLPEGTVLRPPRPSAPTTLDEAANGEVEQALRALDRRVIECAPGDTHSLGPFTVTAVPASDGLGSPQVSWVVEASGRRVLHAGDTLWHGGWWDVAIAHGPIDVACLPANGARTAFPQWQPPVRVPTVMTPGEAVEAAHALGARTMVPIHYDTTFEHPDFYRPQDDVEATLRELAQERSVALSLLEPGEWTEVSELAPA